LNKDVGGGEWFQFYRFDPASGDVTLLTDGQSRNLGDVWSNRGIALPILRLDGTAQTSIFM